MQALDGVVQVLSRWMSPTLDQRLIDRSALRRDLQSALAEAMSDLVQGGFH